jgi:hypothetical protein
VGLKVDYTRAAEVLEDAIEVAESGEPVPDEWFERTEEIARSSNKTFTAALGTGLLARAAHPEVDPLALKAESGDRAYSARTLAHNVLVPASKRSAFDLGARGREPLNNQPFFRYDRIDAMDRLRAKDRDAHSVLVEYLSDVDGMSCEEAQAALAAYLRSRLAAEVARAGARKVDLRDIQHTLTDLIAAAESFLDEKAESGKRAQALVAGAMDIAFDEVVSDRVNSPSRKRPGDVQAFEGGEIVLAVEVRQKVVTVGDASAFAGSLESKGVANGLVVVLDRSGKHVPLDRDEVLAKAESDYGVLVNVIEGVTELLAAAVAWAGRPVDEILRELPSAVAQRLDEIEADAASIRRWASYFE